VKKIDDEMIVPSCWITAGGEKAVPYEQDAPATSSVHGSGLSKDVAEEDLQKKTLEKKGGEEEDCGIQL